MFKADAHKIRRLSNSIASTLGSLSPDHSSAFSVLADSYMKFRSQIALCLDGEDLEEFDALFPPTIDVSKASSMRAEAIFKQQEVASQARALLGQLVGWLNSSVVEVQRSFGTKVFIGHGASQSWRQLKDFVQDRLNLQWDEFNRVPVAGVTNVERLVQMLGDAGIALPVLTAEDELNDGMAIARQNVVHEAGLFQGRLGFSRAIVLLEDGCEEFSNIQGLGQIRFPKDRIDAAFEDVRRVLEREGFLSP